MLSALAHAADIGNESTESDDEFQICDICNGEEVNYFESLHNMQSFDYYLLLYIIATG